MNIKSKSRGSALLVTVLFLFLSIAPVFAASPWAAKQGYGERTWGKFCYGLKNSLLGWMTPWAEAKNPKYPAQWVGYSAGIGEGVLYTAGGLAQLATFFIPADFPDMGYGLPIPSPERVKNPPKPYAPYSKNKK